MHKGIAVSPGVVVGVAYRLDSVFGSNEPQALTDPSQVAAEVERFDRAVVISASELEAIVVKVAQQLGTSEADIFRSHLQIVNDQTLLAKVRTLIETQHLTALSALQQVLQGYAATFARIEHDYFRERMTDIRDVISRIGSHLTLQAPLLPALFSWFGVIHSPLPAGPILTPGIALARLEAEGRREATRYQTPYHWAAAYVASAAVVVLIGACGKPPAPPIDEPEGSPHPHPTG